MAFHLYKRGSVSGTFAQNVNLFTPALPADLRGLFNGIWNVAITPTTSSSFEYSTDDGVTFFPLLTTPVPADQETVCNFLAEGSDLFQIRCTDVAGCTLFKCVVSLAPQDIQRRVGAGGSSSGDVTIVAPLPLPVDITAQTFSPLVVSGSGDFDIVNGSESPLDVKDVNVLKDDISSLARAIDQEWFATDISPSIAVGFSSHLLFTFCYTAKAIIEVSLDSGSTWCMLNGGDEIDEDTINNFFIPVINGDLVNFRADSAGTVQYARVTETGA